MSNNIETAVESAVVVLVELSGPNSALDVHKAVGKLEKPKSGKIYKAKFKVMLEGGF